MRYYEFVLNTNAKRIEKDTKVNLREYEYDNPVAAMNGYMYKNMKNNIHYFAYREEENGVWAAFSYDEKKFAFMGAYTLILGMLNDAFKIREVKTEPDEITMYEFCDCIRESKRREYFCFHYKSERMSTMTGCASALVDKYIFHLYKELCYDLQERIISKEVKKINGMYDKSLVKELSNIENHRTISGFEGNVVHYIIACRSAEAAGDITEILMQKLAAVNRISGRRMEMIRDIDPEMYKKENHLENFIENNYGGVIVMDLSEKFGCDPVDYGMNCQYIERLVKKYKNDCLFVFTYNMDKPGFAYQLLPLIKKHVIPVMLREGSGDRKTAVRYMEELVKGSKYAKYAGQVNEFMEFFQGNEFSQTDVLTAFEKFEPWCLNRNVFKTYDYEISDEFMLERDENDGTSYDKLNKMIGLTSVKKKINDIIATDIVEKERKKRQGSAYESKSMHMIFSGNPGTAKTTVARLFAGIAKERRILKSGAFVERGGMDLDGPFCKDKIRRAFDAAKGGVLFIDEAYALNSDIAVTVLIQEMENRREEVIVVLAGYNERMKKFMEINEGLKSRVPYWIDFPDYSADELTDIFCMMVKERGFVVEEEAVREAYNIFEKVSYMDDFGNGRYVRNLIDHATQNQSVRLLGARENAEKIEKKELFLLTREDISTLEEGIKEERKRGTARKELDKMIGLSSVKEVVNKAIASFKVKKICVEKGISKEKPSMHMVFTGNPGTAKTTVARLFAEILKDEKVLPSGIFVEVGRADLVGDHVGTTAPLVRKKFKEAQGGVLFIDEAYSLCDSYENGFGDEAINTIVQEMENHREDVIVIFAGYPEPMRRFLDVNPGMSSRIAFHIEFEDYSTDELCDITKLMLARKQMVIADAAMEKLKRIYEKARENNSYGNGRFVRKVIEEAEMNLAERAAKLDESKLTVQLLTTIVEADISEPRERERKAKKSLGFCVA